MHTQIKQCTLGANREGAITRWERSATYFDMLCQCNDHSTVGTCVWSVSNKKHCKPNIYVKLKKLGTKDVKYLAISFFFF